ncbi:hypothetical protein [Bacillus salacetis]|nr:hypothetical protein [Bacillus salacetis]
MKNEMEIIQSSSKCSNILRQQPFERAAGAKAALLLWQEMDHYTSGLSQS